MPQTASSGHVPAKDYSGSGVPVPPSSFGKSFSFGKPSRELKARVLGEHVPAARLAPLANTVLGLLVGDQPVGAARASVTWRRWRAGLEWLSKANVDFERLFRLKLAPSHLVVVTESANVAELKVRDRGDRNPVLATLLA